MGESRVCERNQKKLEAQNRFRERCYSNSLFPLFLPSVLSVSLWFILFFAKRKNHRGTEDTEKQKEERGEMILTSPFSSELLTRQSITPPNRI